MLVRIHLRRPWTAFIHKLRDPHTSRHLLARIALVLAIAPAAILGAIYTVHGQTVDTLGQHLTIGIRTPTWSLSGPGEWVLNDTPMDIKSIDIYGPLRPQITNGPLKRGEALARAINPVTSAEATQSASQAIMDGFIRWFGLATLVVLVIAISLFAVIALIRHRIWHQDQKGFRVVVTSVMAIWFVLAGLSALGSKALANINTLDDLVGHGVIHLSPQPFGPKLPDYQAVVIGDSRASRVGGKPLPKPTPDDAACDRSADSLAGLIGQRMSWNVLNLACSRATIRAGLMGIQSAGGREIPAQMSIVKQMPDLKLVVVMIGPNDLNWSDTLKLCYGLAVCNDNLTTANFDSVRDQFAWDYNDLLTDLRDLPSAPQVIVNLSYDVFDGDASCPDALDIYGKPLGQDKIELFKQRNAELNAILTGGAKQYQFDVAQTHLQLLCHADPAGTGPEILGLHEQFAFHPTQIGEILIAKTNVDLIRSD